jgi:hypothetical protein
VDDGALQIHSYRVVFDLERRIHRIDRFRVPLPYGLPLRSLAYGLAALAAVFLLQQLAGIRQLLGVLPPPARLVLLPTAISYGLTRLKLDGRSAHAAAGCWLRYVVGPRELVAFDGARHPRAAVIADIAMAPDATGGDWRPGTVVGPASVDVGGGAEIRRRRRRTTVIRSDERARASGDQFVVRAGERLLLR